MSPLPSAVTHDPKGEVEKKLRAFCENGLNWLRTNKSAGMSNIEPSISHEIWLGEEVTHGNRLSISISFDTRFFFLNPFYIHIMCEAIAYSAAVTGGGSLHALFIHFLQEIFSFVHSFGAFGVCCRYVCDEKCRPK